MKKLPLFDLIMIITFVVVGLLGGGAWWYLSGQLNTLKQNDLNTAASDFNKYTTKEIYLPTSNNVKILRIFSMSP